MFVKFKTIPRFFFLSIWSWLGKTEDCYTEGTIDIISISSSRTSKKIMKKKKKKSHAWIESNLNRILSMAFTAKREIRMACKTHTRPYFAYWMISFDNISMRTIQFSKFRRKQHRKRERKEKKKKKLSIVFHCGALIEPNKRTFAMLKHVHNTITYRPYVRPTPKRKRETACVYGEKKKGVSMAQKYELAKKCDSIEYCIPFSRQNLLFQ